ncbi:hypothetical protein QSJ18_14400 [Gordonia sp. ABSL1-1]|uniref:hypothetical protein n=1 Tax=Gordonia sp. ABSL1-1 TaxID=3053923 RepID=UPI00257270ED|nr:hypothetical protein [Gordonia sp. ABSL1-1]MDL9937941.1 hypothetical protein [Gordonia sp. ABSL1-1]
MSTPGASDRDGLPDAVPGAAPAQPYPSQPYPYSSQPYSYEPYSYEPQSPPGHYPPPGPPQRRDRTRLRNAGKWMTWIGVTLLVVCVAVGATLAIIGFSKIAGQVDELFPVDPTARHVVAAGDSLQMFTFDDAARDPHCSYRGPGQVMAGPNVETSFGYHGRQLRTFDVVRFPVAGTYTIVCDGPAFAAPALKSGQILMGVVGLLLAIFGGGFGMLLIVVGLLMWLVFGRRTAR